MREIVLATKNKGKLTELQAMLADMDIRVFSLADFPQDNIVEVAETGATFYENAQIKAEAYRNMLRKPVLADDSGLVIDALDGRPGIFSARYAGSNASDLEHIAKVLTEMQAVPYEKRTARFVAVLAFADLHKETVFFKGECEGTIALSPRGEKGFGYDPIFIPHGYEQTMAELTSAEKNRISHRYHALQQFKHWLVENQY